MIEEDLRIWPYELLGDLLNESAIAMSAKEAKEAQPYKSFNDSVSATGTFPFPEREWKREASAETGTLFSTLYGSLVGPGPPGRPGAHATSNGGSVRSRTTAALGKRHNRHSPSELPWPRVPAVEVAERGAS